MFFPLVSFEMFHMCQYRCKRNDLLPSSRLGIGGAVVAIVVVSVFHSSQRST